MGKDDRHMACAADLKCFAHRIENGFSFRAHVRDVDRAGSSEGFGERQDLLRRERQLADK